MRSISATVRPNSTPRPGLLRNVGLLTATSVVIANVLGGGVFTTPGSLARDIGSPCAVLGIWVLGAILALAGALSYSELGAAFPEAVANTSICEKRMREAYGGLLGIATALASVPLYY